MKKPDVFAGLFSLLNSHFWFLFIPFLRCRYLVIGNTLRDLRLVFRESKVTKRLADAVAVRETGEYRRRSYCRETRIEIVRDYVRRDEMPIVQVRIGHKCSLISRSHLFRCRSQFSRQTAISVQLRVAHRVRIFASEPRTIKTGIRSAFRLHRSIREAVIRSSVRLCRSVPQSAIYANAWRWSAPDAAGTPATGSCRFSAAAPLRKTIIDYRKQQKCQNDPGSC